MLQVIRFLRGYLTIKVWGFSPERFMNLCSNHNIFLWNVINHGEFYSMNISLKAFYKLRPITRKTGTRVVITNRYGLAFLSVKMWKRKIFLLGLLSSLMFWMWMSGFIWAVEIEGNHFVTTDVFLDFLKEKGVESGIKKKTVNIEELEKEIRTKFNIVTWTSAKIDGTKLVIQLKENHLTTVQKKEYDSETGMDLVASKDGIVISIVTRSGIPRVKAGDVVKKGDILVDGGIPILGDDAMVKHYNFCVADADILLQCIYTMKEEQQEKYQRKQYTGKQQNRFFLMVHTAKVHLPYFPKKFEAYDLLEEKTQLKLFENYYLPVYIGQNQVKEYVLEDKFYSKEEVKILFEEKIMKFIETLEEKGVQIIEKNVTINKTAGIWKMNVDFLVIEKTGILQNTLLQQVEETEQSDLTEQVQE